MFYERELLPALPEANQVAFELSDVTLGGYIWMPSGTSDRRQPTAVVLLHGWGEDASDLAAVGRKVAGLGEYAISLSMRGWRGSTGIADYGRSDPHDIHRVATSVREQFAVDRISLIGFSMGGLIALLTAATDPDSSESRIDGVVGVNSPADLRSFYSDTAFNGVRRYFDSTLTDSQWDTCSPLRKAKQITCPALIVVGSLDTMCPPDQGHRLVNDIECAHIVEIGAMAHHPTTAQWDEILTRARQRIF